MDLLCPKCKHDLLLKGDHYFCINCQTKFPIVNNIPVLINEENSIFNIDMFINKEETFFKPVNFLSKVLPGISLNFRSVKNYKRISDFFPDNNVNVLLIGASVDGIGVSVLKENQKFNLTHTDISFGPNTQMICDAHDLPFKDEYFDLVILQAVLEHVIDPVAVVKEMYRVLKKDGYIYSEIPFMQHIHGGKYDFQRYTMLGHALLFKDFEKIDVDILCGPAMAFMWSLQYFLSSFFNNKFFIRLARLFSRFFFPLKYLDYLIIKNMGAYNSASAFYFIGKKTTTPQSISDILTYFKGY